MQGTEKVLVFDDRHAGFILSTGFAVLRPIREEVLPGFLRHWLRSGEFQSAKDRLCSGATQKAITNEKIEKLTIPLPRLGDQQRIVAVLDLVEVLQTKRRASLAQLGVLAQTIFIDLFGDLIKNDRGWPVAQLPEVIYFQEGPGVRNWQFRNEGIKLINVRNIVEGRLVTENTDRFLSPDEVARRYKHFLLDAGDFVLASSGVTWGKIAEVFSQNLPLCLNTSMIRLRPLEGRSCPHSWCNSSG